MASDSIINEPKYSVLGGFHTVALKYASTLLNNPLPMPVVAQQGGWSVTLTGHPGGSDPVVTFLFCDANASTVVFNKKQHRVTPGTALILDAKGKQLWTSDSKLKDSAGQPYVDAGVGPLRWRQWNGTATNPSGGAVSTGLYSRKDHGMEDKWRSSGPDAQDMMAQAQQAHAAPAIGSSAAAHAGKDINGTW